MEGHLRSFHHCVTALHNAESTAPLTTLPLWPIKQTNAEKCCAKMADKKPTRKIVPVFCDRPPPKLEPWEDTWKSINDFSPIRENKSPEPAPLHSRPLHSRPTHRASVLGTRNNRRTDKDENIPPPSTQPRRPVLSPSFSAAPGGSKVSQRSGKFKVKYLCFPNNLFY